MDHAEEPVIFLGSTYELSGADVTNFCCRIEGGVNSGHIHVAPGLELFLTSIVLRRPDIRKIHVFYGKDDDHYSVPSKVFQIASDSMKYSGITLEGYSLSSLDIAKKFARDRRASTTTSAAVKEAILVADDSKHN